MADASTQPKRATKPASRAKNAYLILYNFLSAIGWMTVLGRTIALASTRGPEAVYPGVGEWTRWTQTMAGLEILHSLFGIVRAPVMTTLMQVSSRYLLVWLIVHPFPHLARSPLYTTMLLAWSVTEVIRYSYFARALAGASPGPFTWLRYNTFYVLYPMGIASEVGLVWKAVGPAGEMNALFPLALYGILAVYVPGSYVLYTYMMKQRNKVMKTLKSEDATRKTQ